MSTFYCNSLMNSNYSPFMADLSGRKVPIAVGCLLMIWVGFLGAFCKDYASKSCSLLKFLEVTNFRPVYVVGRLMLGMGNSLAQMSSPVLLTEICHPQHHRKVTTIYNCLWNLGALGECFMKKVKSTTDHVLTSRRLDCMGHNVHPK